MVPLADVLRIMLNYLGLTDVMRLRFMCRESRRVIDKEFDAGWPVNSFKKYLSDRLPHLDIDEFCEQLYQTDSIVAGDALLEWAVGVDWGVNTLSVIRFDGQDGMEYLDESSEYESRGPISAGWVFITNLDTPWDPRQNSVRFHRYKKTETSSFSVTILSQPSILIPTDLSKINGPKSARFGYPDKPLSRNSDTLVLMCEFDALQNTFNGKELYFHHFTDVMQKQMVRRSALENISAKNLFKYSQKGFRYRNAFYY